MELHVIGEKGKEEVILLNENMEIVKPVYDYLKFQKQLGRAINSIRAYGTDLKIYFRYLEMGGLLYEQITPSDILKFIEYLREFDGLKVLHKESSRSAKTINRITGTVYHFYKFCEMTKAIENPVPMRDMNNSFSQYRGLMYHARKDNMTKKSVFKLKEKKHRVKILTQDEAEYFCNNLNRIRDRLIFKVMYLTGARIQEALDLQIKMIPIPDASKKVAVFSQIKSKGKYRDLYVPMSLVEELDNFILNDRCRVETDHDFIFISQQKQNFGKHMTYRGVYEVFKTVQKKLGLYFNFHDLRHTFGSSLVTDTMCEMYVMQSYLQKNALERMGIYHFDSWASNFGEVTTALELTVEGSGFRFKSRFNKFTNLPELMNIFREVADVQTADMLDLEVPKLRDEKYTIVESEPDWYVKQVMENFVVRAERIRNGGVDPSEDNFLKITHEARLLGTDARLLDSDAPNNPDGKLNKVVDNIAFEYRKAIREDKIGCQLVFSDIGTPKSSWSPEEQPEEFDIYNYVKSELVRRGIPANEIAFIHDAKSDPQRDALFKDMRTGKKKILIGSTDKCGTGVNVQTHLVAMHHIDCPWKPSSIEQREGRGIRQGNENSEIAVYRYVTKGTFDAYSWSLVENKQRFISQVMTSKSVSRTCEDIDEATLSYAEIKAVATGNPLIREKMELDNDVQRLKLLKASYDSQRYSLQDNFMLRFPKLIKAAEEKLTCVHEDIMTRDKQLIASPEFCITIGKSQFAERVDGGTVMLEAISKCKTGDIYPIGRFKGFDLLVEKNYMGVNYMVLRGKTEYKAELSTSPVGNMVKLENTFNGLSENEEFLIKKIDQYQRDMEQSKQEYEKPFSYETELKEKLARQFALNAELDLENSKVEDVDLNGVEVKDNNVPDSNVAERGNDYLTGPDNMRR